MQKRILRADIDFHPIFDSKPFYSLQALSYLLISPFVSRGNGKPKQVDNAPSIELCGHYTDLTVIKDGVEVGIDNYFWRVSETRQGGER
jgi:hypothetical protein